MHKKKLTVFILSTISVSLLLVTLCTPKMTTEEKLRNIKVVSIETESEIDTETDNTVEVKIETEEEIIVETETETIKAQEIEVVKAENVTEFKPVFYLSEYERRVVECIVMGESGGEPYKGQLLVAQCLLNACLKDGLQPSEVRKAYKYSGWNSNPSESVKNAVREVFDNGYKVTNEYILYFYAPKLCNSKWHETQRFVTQVGGHRFFARWD